MDLGAELGPDGTTFRVHSSVATSVELCLFDQSGDEADRLSLAPDDDGNWAVLVAGVDQGQRYGYRVDGPADRSAGHAADPAKLLIDPAARRLDGSLTWAADLWEPGVDSAPFVPRSVVTAAAEATRLRRPRPWNDTFVYEAHVGHLTARHPDVPPEHRGRYLGLAAPVIIDHLHALGVTAIELLPIQHFASEPDLIAAGQRNVWGYNPLAWGAPHVGYASPGGNPVAELRTAVAALHDAGIEVWLDVVFNHTAEGTLESGPTLSWRGFDNAGAYRLLSQGGRLVDENLSGCGNSIDTRSPSMRRLIRQMLVRWVREFGIDGFRFDLAATLIRADADADATAGPDRPSRDAPLLAELAATKELDGVKLIAEPWDLGPDGYAPDQFPPPWRVWNDRFRDDVRQHWTEGGTWSRFASRLAASADVFGRLGGHDATVGINAVVTHDGQTLADLVPDLQTRRAILATLVVAQGVPMVSSGDEIGRSQGGERDGYRLEPDQWGLDWRSLDQSAPDDLSAWLGAAMGAWHDHPALRRSAWVAPTDEAIRWRDPSGAPMSTATWEDEDLAGFAFELAAPTTHDRNVVVLVVRAGTVNFALPRGAWRRIIDSHDSTPPTADEQGHEGRYVVEGPAVVVLASTEPTGDG